MKKFISFSALSLTLLLTTMVASNSAKAQAAPIQYETLTCNATCAWSSCTVSITVVKGSGASVACGCYFGLAMCDSENGIVVSEEKDVVVDHGAVMNCVSYLNGLENSGDFINVINVLNTFYAGMSTIEYNISRSDYVIAVDLLSPANRNVLALYTGYTE